MTFNIGDNVFFIINSDPETLVFGTITRKDQDGFYILTNEQSTVYRFMKEVHHIPNPLKIISLNDLIKLRELAGASMLRLENPHWSGELQANTVVCLGCDKINLDGKIEHKQDCYFAQLWERTDPVKLKSVENEI